MQPPVSEEFMEKQLARTERSPWMMLAILLLAAVAFLGWLLYEQLQERIKDRDKMLQLSEERKNAVQGRLDAKEELLREIISEQRRSTDTFARR